MIRSRGLTLLAAAALAGCGSMRPPPPAAPATVSAAALYQKPAERALLKGLTLYEQGTFDSAEQSFQAALKAGLADRRDVATAYKSLAFVACAFNRLDECAQDFRSAFAADDRFALTDAEVGHPIWGPVYKRVAAERARKD